MFNHPPQALVPYRIPTAQLSQPTAPPSSNRVVSPGVAGHADGTVGKSYPNAVPGPVATIVDLPLHVFGQTTPLRRLSPMARAISGGLRNHGTATLAGFVWYGPPTAQIEFAHAHVIGGRGRRAAMLRHPAMDVLRRSARNLPPAQMDDEPLFLREAPLRPTSGFRAR